MEGRLKDVELMESALSTAASMQILADELDRVSVHSSLGLQSNSRDSLLSSSKYDSAFDSHYSEDAVSLNSQVLSISYPVDMQTSTLPSILPPPLPYRVVTTTRDETPSPSPASKRSHAKKGVRLRDLTSMGPCRSSSPSPSPLTRHLRRTVSHLMTDLSLPVVHKPERIYVEASSPTRGSAHRTTPAEAETTLIVPTKTTLIAPASSEVTPTKPATQLVEPRANDVAFSSSVARRFSESSSTDDLISNDSTPTVERRHPRAKGDELVEPPLSPRVTIVYPNHSDSDHTEDSSPLARRHAYFPRTGTVFYQDSLTPRQSPLTVAHRHTSPSHLLPSRYQDATHSPRPVKRTGSILQRLIRKRGSFKEEGVIKRRLPVMRSLSDRMAYHIRKGWIDYEEDLDFISQPTHPRPVGRMIDKKAGRLHVVQLYKPPNGRYGVYISQTGQKKGVYISRFANSVAEKFFTGLISPGDQIVRVNGKNIREQSVDDVYDLMTVSDSVIFTVIPVSSRLNWLA